MARAFVSCFQVVLASAVGRPNIIYFLSDDLGWHDVGFKNDNLMNTPNINKIAEDGLILDQFYVQSVCSPTRASLMTGRYPLHNTVVDWLRTGVANALPLNETLVPEVLADAGYKSHMQGKWHLGETTWQHTPTFRGFESFVGYYGGGENYFTHLTGGLYDFRRDMKANCGIGCSQVAFDGDSGRYSTHIFSEEAVRVIEEHDAAEAPLFMFLSFQSVHSPRQVPASYVEPYADTIADEVRRDFAGMVSAMDEGIGNVTKALEAKGMLSNSLIVFSTDNGGATFDTPGGDYAGSSNYPLRGGKHSIWEGGTRGVAAVWAGADTGLLASQRRGSTVTNLMHAVDWLPTFCSVAGISDACAALPLDGVDQSGPLFNGDMGSPRIEVFYGMHDDAPESYAPYDTALRDMHGWKLIQGTGGKPSSWSPSLNLSAVGAAQCGTRRVGTCYPDNDMEVLDNQTEDECCAACSANDSCNGYTYRNSTGVCYIKSSLGTSKQDSDCASAGKDVVDGPLMLFNVLEDPEERNEVSVLYPEIVDRLSKRINELRSQRVEVIGGGTKTDETCPTYNKKDHVDDKAGYFVEPWCDHETLV